MEGRWMLSAASLTDGDGSATAIVASEANPVAAVGMVSVEVVYRETLLEGGFIPIQPGVSTSDHSAGTDPLTLDGFDSTSIITPS
jgi:hypothetical protein